MTSPASESASAAEKEVSLLSLVNVLLRRRRLMAWCIVLFVVAVALVGLIPKRTWTATTTFVPQGKKSGAGVQALAAQFGLPISPPEANESPAFYADLVRSREILGGVVDAPLLVNDADRQVRMEEHYRLRQSTAALRRDAAIRRLAGDVSVVTNAKTGVVTVRVSLSDPAVSTAVATRILELLNRFNLETRRSQAIAERRFAEGRLAEVATDLRRAEDTLQRFLQRNRDFRNSPELMFQQERLARVVGLQQELYTTLAQSYEQAKLDAVRDTPVITVLERPEQPVLPDSRSLLGKGIIAVIAGFVFGATLALLLESTSPSGGAPDEAKSQFRRLAAETGRDFRRPWRLLRGPKAPPVPTSTTTA